MKECRNCIHFEKEIDIEVTYFDCLKKHFLKISDDEGYPISIANNCEDFVSKQ